MTRFRIKMAFDDWRRKGESIYQTAEGIRLSSGDYHSGTVFHGSILVDDDQAAQFRRALADGANPVFLVFGIEAPGE